MRSSADSVFEDDQRPDRKRTRLRPHGNIRALLPLDVAATMVDCLYDVDQAKQKLEEKFGKP